MADNPYGLSAQDVQDLQQIAMHLGPSDPRRNKVNLLLNSAPTQFEKDRAQAVSDSQDVRNPWSQIGHDAPGVIGATASEVGNLAKAVPGMITGAMEGPAGVASQAVQTGLKIGAEDAQRRQDGRSLPYRVAAGTGSAIGVNAKGMEDAADVGNYRGVLGTALGDAAPVVAGEILKTPQAQRVVAKLPSAASDAAKRVTAPLRGEPMFPSKAANVMPEAANLPPDAVSGAEDIFRAAAPTGMNKGFRANVYAAAGDLADVARKADLSEAKGGMVNPDLRVRATVEALRNHLDEMYQTERAPQIQRNANVPVKVAGNADAARGLEYLESTAGTEQVRSLATKAIENKALTVSEADTLAQAANQNLKTFEKMTPEGKTQAQITNPKIGGLKALDQELGRNLNDTLTANGEPGLRSYERRFAAVSAIRDALESRMNAVELQRTGAMKTLGKVVAPLTGGKAAIASASQAAVADANIGRTLQRGLTSLAKSKLTAGH